MDSDSDDSFGPKPPPPNTNNSELEHVQRQSKINIINSRTTISKAVIESESGRDEWMLNPPEALQQSLGNLKSRRFSTKGKESHDSSGWTAMPKDRMKVVEETKKRKIDESLVRVSSRDFEIKNEIRLHNDNVRGKSLMVN
jgi:hypothetical protein